MNELFQKILWYIFGIIVTTTIAQKNNNGNNPRNIVWENIISSDNKSLPKNIYLHNKNIEQDIKSVLKVFNKIDFIFENMEENEDVFCEHRYKRYSSHLDQRSECTVSKKELLEMQNEIKKLLQTQDLHSSENNNCNFNMETGNCQELINLIKCGIQNLKNHFVEITTLNDVSTNDFNKWQIKYEKLNKVYLRLADDLTKSNKQKYMIKMDELNKELIHLKEIIDKLGEDLKAANENIIQITIEFCGSEIHSKKVEPCIEKLKQIKNVNYTEIINKIIDRSFMYIMNENEMIIIEYIVDFINKQDEKLKYHGYEYLYNMMDVRGFLSSPYVFTFASKVENYQNQDLKMYINNKIDEWSKKIINGNNWQINTFAEKQDFSFCYYFKNIITYAFANNIKNAKKIIYFLDNLPTIKQKALGYYHLYNEIKLKHGFNGDEIIMLLYRIKEILNHNLKLEYSVVLKLKTIKSEIPLSLQTLLWDNYLSIRSKFNGYKLLSLHKYFGYTIYTETILAICPSFVDGADKWKITAVENGSYFKVKNYASNHDEEYYWKINAHNNGQNLYFVNNYTGHKLYTKDTIGEWIGFWYAIPKDCYQVYDDYDSEQFEQWLVN